MTPEELDKLEAIVKAMTPGDWYVDSSRRGIETQTDVGAVEVGAWMGQEDAAAIVALHNAAPALIAAAREVERLRAFVPVWRREDEHTLHLTLGPVALGGVMGPHPVTGAWGAMIMDEDAPTEHPDLPTAAAAVYARLGIPSVEVGDE